MIQGYRLLLSLHFNLTVKLLLKTIVCGYSWTVMPVTRSNGRSGGSKLQLKETGSRNPFIGLNCWLQKYFNRGNNVARITEDKRKKDLDCRFWRLTKMAAARFRPKLIFLK